VLAVTGNAAAVSMTGAVVFGALASTTGRFNVDWLWAGRDLGDAARLALSVTTGPTADTEFFVDASVVDADEFVGIVVLVAGAACAGFVAAEGEGSAGPVADSAPRVMAWGPPEL
jgi:hypothetical protein